jgi:dTDP-4-amino-4,6-dideoxygalactose transaminase
VQAIVGNWLIKDVHDITARRIANAARYDAGLGQLPQIRVPERPRDSKRVFHLYIVFARNRDALFQHCLEAGIEAKVHYPIPLYQQKGLAHLGYRPGDFPVADRHAREIISFPCDQHLSEQQVDYVIETVRSFYGGR